MAEPAWVLRTPRPRVRPRTHSRRGSGWLRSVSPSLDSRRPWLAWFLLLLSALLPYMTSTSRAGRACQAARAILEGAPMVNVGASEEDCERAIAYPSWKGVPRLPFRYAAHITTIALVLPIVLVARDVSSRAGVLKLDAAHGARARRTTVVDPQVRPVVPLPRGYGDHELVSPALRAPQVQSEPTFIESHRLAEGETLGELAARYRVSVASLVWANGLQSGEVLAAGQELRIPRLSGIPHVIQPGETLESIAGQFGVPPQAILLFRANEIRMDRPLPVGREIFIPSGTLPYPAEIVAQYSDENGIAGMRAVLAGVVEESETNLRAGPGREYPRLAYLDAGRQMKLLARHGEWIKVQGDASGSGWVRADLLGLTEAIVDRLPETNDFPPPPPRWVWPTRGEITSSFGWRSQPFRSFHDGLDMANRAGTPILAASGGQVIEAGWCRGFGYCVKIDHGQGIKTIYAHMLKKPPVATGDAVAAGDIIGSMGSTYDKRGGGYSTGVHLHFIIMVNGNAVNPIKFLS